MNKKDKTVWNSLELNIFKKYDNCVTFFRRLADRIVKSINSLSVKKLTICAAVLFAVSLIPILLLGRYNVMCVDDYNYGIAVHDAWLATGSFKEALRSAIEQVKLVYMTIQGAYTSCFLMSLCPMNFSYESAFVVPIIMVGLFSVSTFLLGRQMLTRWLGADRHRAAFVMFILLFMYYQVIEAPFEGIYWYNGSVHYIFMEALFFIILTLVSYSILEDKNKTGRVISCTAAAILAPINAGCNIVTALQAEVLLLFLLIYVCVVKKKRLFYVLIPYLTYTAGFLCNMLAPGHRVRAGADVTSGCSPLMSILLSFYHAPVFMIKWTSVFVILIWLALLPVLWRIAVESDKKFEHPFWMTAGAYCIISAMFTPTLYGLGTVGLARVDNIIQMVYYLSIVLVTVYWLGFVSHGHKKQNRIAGKRSDKELSGSVTETSGMKLGKFLESTGNMMTISFLLLVCVVWIFTADKNTYTGISALRSLIIGDGRAYYTESMERHELYVDKKVRDVEVKPYSAKPALFKFDDLSPDKDYWLNTGVTEYYHKHSIRLVEKDG